MFSTAVFRRMFGKLPRASSGLIINSTKLRIAVRRAAKENSLAINRDAKPFDTYEPPTRPRLFVVPLFETDRRFLNLDCDITRSIISQRFVGALRETPVGR